MKTIGITSTAILSLLLGIAVPVYAQHDPQDGQQDHAKQEQSKHEQAKPEQQHTGPRQRQDQNKQQQRAEQQQRQDQNKQQHAERQQRQDQNKQQQHAEQQQRQDQNRQRDRQHEAQRQRGNERPLRTQQQQRVERSAWQEHRSQRWDSDHRTWQQRGGYHGYRIPQDRFRGYFGPDHGFRIYGLPFMVVSGYPRFQYEGYWISLVDPWPEYWGNDWYDNDDVYVAYVDNGYYLYNRRYPNVGVAVNISF